MEAVLVRPSNNEELVSSTSSSSLAGVHDDLSSDVLPPPPAPFPIDQIRHRESQRPLTDDTQVDPVSTSSGLESIQQSCVEALQALLPNDDGNQRMSPTDQRLASILSDLLEASYELEKIQHAHQSSLLNTHDTSANSSIGPTGPVGAFSRLERDLSEIHKSALSRPPPAFEAQEQRQDLHPAINFVHEELVWGRVESLSHAGMECLRLREREKATAGHGDGIEVEVSSSSSGDEGQQTEISTPHHPSPDPPEYTTDEVDQLPGYDGETTRSDVGSMEKASLNQTDGAAGAAASRPSLEGVSDEKMRRDLNNVYDAIERLYSVAPRLQDQRVEMRPSTSADGRRQTEFRRERQKMKELEQIWDLIERTHKGRRTDRQRADVWTDFADETGQSASVSRRRERFFDQLASSSETGRLTGQDSAMRTVDRDLARARNLRLRDVYVKRMMRQGQLSPELSPDQQDKKQAFISDIIARTRASRLNGQDYQLTLEERMAERRASFIDNLVESSSARRFNDQCSLPPTPKTANPTLDDSTERVSMADFLRSSPGPRAHSRLRSRSLPLGDGDSSRNAPKSLRKRFVGMVRKSTIGLDMQDKKEQAVIAGYIAEYQENLRAVQVKIYGTGMTGSGEYCLDTTSSTEAAVKSPDGVELECRICLPSPVRSGQSIPLINANDHLDARLAALPAPDRSTAPNSPNHQHPLSAPDLRSIHPSAFYCSSCKRCLSDLRQVIEAEDTTLGSGFKNLPSEHWAEMMEVWMCHPDPGFTSRLAEKTKSGFWPTQSQVLVGNSYVLVHPDNMPISNIPIPSPIPYSDTPSASNWTGISCVCGAALGKQYDAPRQPGNGTFRFNKWSISVHDKGIGSNNIPLSAYIVSDMLELAQAHASYRFNIREEETGDPRLKLWLFTPSFRVSYLSMTSSASETSSTTLSAATITTPASSTTSRRRSFGPALTSYESAEPKIVRAAKIMYKMCDSSPSSDTGTVLPGFGPNGQVETLTYSRDVCDRLIQMLQGTNSRYPTSSRKMGGFDVGFLERV